MDINPAKILIIARGGIGNVLMFTPTLELLKERFRDSEIHMLVLSNGSKKIVSANPNVNKIITCDKDPWQWAKVAFKIYRNKYDLVITMFPGGLRSALWSYVSRAQYRLGYDMSLLKGLGKHLYTHLSKPDKSLHDVEHNLKFMDVFGMDGNKVSTGMKIYIPQPIKSRCKKFIGTLGIGSKERLIGIHPGSNISQKWKRWPAIYYGKTINMIYSEWGTYVMIFGTESERDLLDEIHSKVNKDVKLVKVIGRDIIETASLIAFCKAFIGNDSGLIHVAAANKVPTLCIAGPTDVRKTGPYGQDTFIIHSNNDCIFCYDFNTINFKCSKKPRYKCLNELYPEEVIKQIRPVFTKLFP